MKKLLIPSLCLLFALPSFSQGEYNYLSMWQYNNHSFLGYKPVAVENTTVELVTTKNGKETRRWKEQFDEYGMLIASIRVIDGEEQLVYSGKYLNENQLQNAKSYKKNGNVKLETTLDWTSSGKYKLVKQFKNGKLKNTQEWMYKPEGCVEKSTYTKGNGKIKNTWLYEYYSECDKKRSVLLNAKGKVKKEWSFDCKKEGEQLVKKNDVTQICKWEETEDDYLIKIYQSFDDKGRLYKTISKYRAADTAIVSTRKLNGNDQLVYEYTYDFDYKKPLKYRYYKKGQIKYGYDYIYENDRKVAYTYLRKGEVVARWNYEYNEKGLLTSSKYFKKDGELYSSTVYNYN